MIRTRHTLTISLILIGLFGLIAAETAAPRPSGRVLSAGEPISGALVFVSGTTTSVETGVDGTFDLPATDLAWYDIAAWHSESGFGVIRHDPARASADATIELEAVDSGAGASPSGDDLQFFRDIAFAWTGNSNDIEIANPDVLLIERGSDGYSVTATAAAPLRLVNPELGYEIVMHQFRLTGSPVNISWEGFPLFIEMEADGRRAQRRITRGRESAFHGSVRHLMHALAFDRLKEEDFEAFHVQGPGDQSELNPIAEMKETGLGMGEIDPVLREGSRPGSHEFIFQGWVRVEYLGSGVENRFVRYVDRFYPASDVKDILLRAAEPEVTRDADRLAGQGMGNQAQQSSNQRPVSSTWIRLPLGAVAVDPAGSILPQEGGSEIQMVGYMSFLRLAELLPYDYLPE